MCWNKFALSACHITSSHVLSFNLSSVADFLKIYLLSVTVSMRRLNSRNCACSIVTPLVFSAMEVFWYSGALQIGLLLLLLYNRLFLYYITVILLTAFDILSKHLVDIWNPLFEIKLLASKFNLFHYNGNYIIESLFTVEFHCALCINMVLFLDRISLWSMHILR